MWELGGIILRTDFINENAYGSSQCTCECPEIVKRRVRVQSQFCKSMPRSKVE